ncbi:hypothetical protein COO60DRAFT_864737 [Scenedesmus sp. NREL 46B-D3]|nr:hypothetical protein COO60DRAFT_864737 [Scenedesmus sp. NREL 46B-D3]
MIPSLCGCLAARCAFLLAQNWRCCFRVTPSMNMVDVEYSAALFAWPLLHTPSSLQLRTLFCCAVRVLRLSTSDLKRCGVEQLSRLPSLFPDLSELHLQLGSDTDLLLALRQLTRSSSSSHSSSRQQLRHLRVFSLDSRLCGDAFQALANFLMQQPGLAKLLLPHQRCGSPNDQRALAGLLQALPGLTHLELGHNSTAAGSSSSSGRAGRVSDSSTSSSGGGSPAFDCSCSAAAAAAAGQVAAGNAVCASVFRRVLRLQGLRMLSCNANGIPDAQLEALSTLRSLQELRLSAAGSGQGLAAGLQGLSGLSSLELQHPCVCGELQGCLGGLHQLQVLALGLCPKLTDVIMPEVAQLRQLEKLTLPFPLAAPHLRLLSHLPCLQELYSWRHIELDVLGPAHEPLLHVTRLVAGSINGHGKSLTAWFPALETLCLKRCSDLAALSLRSCVGLQELLAGECSQLSDEGFACLRGFKALQRLQVEGASQLTDAAFSAVFGGTMPALQQVSIAGCPAVSDAALQLLTGSCRRLTAISIGSCRQLSDKTLKRLAHCEHLSSVVLKGCRGFTAEGVAALAAAPQMKQVLVNGCMGVRSSLCKGYRPGVKVRVEERL